MTTKQEMTLICAVVKNLTDRGSWCGETHIQKTVYLTKYLRDVPFESEFVLYKHGPYSFDLNKSLLHMRARNVLVLVSNAGGYGPSYQLNSGMWKALLGAFQGVYNENALKIQDICSKVARRNVSDLERIATAYYVSANFPEIRDENGRVGKLTELKPHIGREMAALAFRELSTI